MGRRVDIVEQLQAEGVALVSVDDALDRIRLQRGGQDATDGNGGLPNEERMRGLATVFFSPGMYDRS